MTDTDTPEPTTLTRPEPVGVHVALARVMGELPAIGKLSAAEHAAQRGNAAPERGISYSYRGIDQITGAAQHLFAKHGVVIVPSVVSLRVVDIVVGGKPWTDTTLEVDYTLVGPDGSTLTARTVGIGRDNSDKGANKAMTQAFKYLLLQVLCISDVKDDADGHTHEADAHTPAPEPAPLDDELVARARAVFEAAKQLDDDAKAELRTWKGDRSMQVTHMASDPIWLEAVEGWFAGQSFLNGAPDQPADDDDDAAARRRELAAAKRAELDAQRPTAIPNTDPDES